MKPHRHAALVLLAWAALALSGGCILFNSPPVADFTFALSQRYAPCVVNFDASLSCDPDGIVIKHEWSFGDGSTGVGKLATHTYSASGAYTVTLEVADDHGASSSSSATFDIHEPYAKGITAAFEASPRSYMVPPFTVQLDASASSSDHGVITAYSWGFGDGSTGSGRTVLHTYPGPGSYIISLTVIDVQGTTDSTSQAIQVSAGDVVGGNILPIASFTASPTSGVAPLLVAFDASNSSDPDGSIASYSWSFGDGTGATGVAAPHTYNSAGTFTASLTVVDNQGAVGSTTRTVQVSVSGGNISPIASFTASPTSGVAPLLVAFDASNSSDPDGSIASYSWSFGDGTGATGVAAPHTYNSAGTFTASLTVTDNEGTTASTTKTISVAPQAAPQSLAGYGSQVTASFTLASGLATFRMQHDGSGHFAMVLRDNRGQWVDLLVNEIGSFDGGKVIGVGSSGIYVLDVSASGNWTVTIEQPTPSSAPAPPQSYTGHGQEFSPLFRLAAGLATYRMQHDGTGHFAMVLRDNRGQWVDLLVNEIGSFDGGKVIGVGSSGIYVLDVSASGNWTVAIEQPTPSSAPAPPQSYTGHGQEFSPFFRLAPGPATFRMQHDGSGHFAMVLLDNRGEWLDLLANEIGSFDGSKVVAIQDAGICILDISASGSWSVAVEQ